MAAPSPIRFVPVAPELLSRLHNGSRDIPTAYFHRSPIIRRLFSKRLEQSLRWAGDGTGRSACLDLGCGGGALLPSLSKSFAKVIGLDKDIGPAAKLKEALSLDNVELVEHNLYTLSLPAESLDCIFAVSIMEHLDDPAKAIRLLSGWLAPGGVLVVSVPSENLIYRMGRQLFGFTRPEDHHEVQEWTPLLKESFGQVTRYSWPLPLPALTYYRIYVGVKGDA